MGYKITNYSARQRKDNLTNLLDDALEMDFNPFVIEDLRKQLELVNEEIKKDDELKRKHKKLNCFGVMEK